uniref:Large proline-rich protein bag6-like isoform X3 n=1 Tax=Rhizophora mucronata TaxID=61149 RepID=A0A2P2KVR6_RHIMU
MGSHGTDTISAVDGAGGSETMIEIKIKTLDSQTYTLRVDKQVIRWAPSCYVVANMILVHIVSHLYDI